MKFIAGKTLTIVVIQILAGCAGGKSGGNPSGESQQQEDTKTDGATDPTDGGTSQAGTIAISGTFDDAATADVDHVAAVPVYGGRTRESALDAGSAQPVESGQVAITISSGTALRLDEGGGEMDGPQQGGGPGGPADSHVIVAFKKSDDRFATGESFKFISVPVAGGDNAINLYTGSAKVEEIQLGTLTASEESLTASGEISSQQFDLSDSILKELAATDDALRKIKNNYMNFDPATKEYVEIGPFFQWMTDIKGSVNKAPDLTLDSHQYFGYGLYFSSNRKDMGLDTLCSEGSATHKALKLVPPAAIEKKSNTGNTTETVTELTNAGAGAIKAAAGSRQECMGTSFYAHAEGGSGGFNWGGLLGAVTKGYWDLFLADQKVGRFDLAASYPFDAGGKPRTYLPALKITTDGSGKVTAITADLYLYIGGSFVKVTDLTAFRKVVESVTFSFTERVNGQQFELLATARFPESGSTLTVDMSEFKDAWYWVDDENQQVTGGRKISDGAFFYEMYGSSFRFEYRRQQTQ